MVEQVDGLGHHQDVQAADAVMVAPGAEPVPQRGRRRAGDVDHSPESVGVPCQGRPVATRAAMSAIAAALARLAAPETMTNLQAVAGFMARPRCVA